MPVFEVWEYGEGDSPRNWYQAVSEEHAVNAFLQRPLVTGDTFRDHLVQQEQDTMLVCVKDPTKKGTQQEPNYPSVYTLDLRQGALQE